MRTGATRGGRGEAGGRGVEGGGGKGMDAREGTGVNE